MPFLAMGVGLNLRIPPLALSYSKTGFLSALGVQWSARFSLSSGIPSPQ